MTALDIFKKCIDRAKSLIRIHSAAHGNKSRPEAYLADAHRASVVLAVSALDAFIRSFLIARIRARLVDDKQALPPTLAQEIKRFLKDDVLLEAARKSDLLDRVELAFRSDFERKSFQGVKSITEALCLIGTENVFHHISLSASVNEDHLKIDVDKYTKRRHIIAHAGDFDMSKNPPPENTITKPYAENCIKTMVLVATEINKI